MKPVGKGWESFCDLSFKAIVGIVFSVLNGLCEGFLWEQEQTTRLYPGQEYTINARSCWDSRQTLEHLLQPIVLGEW